MYNLSDENLLLYEHSVLQSVYIVSLMGSLLAQPKGGQRSAHATQSPSVRFYRCNDPPIPDRVLASSGRDNAGDERRSAALR